FGLERGLLAVLFPTELDLTAHAGTCGHRERTGLHVARDDAAFLQLDTLGVLDVALELAADGHRLRTHLAVERGAVIDGEVAVDLHVALEATGKADMAGADDLAFDGQIGSDNRLFHLRTLPGARGCWGGIERGHVARGRGGTLGLTRKRV